MTVEELAKLIDGDIMGYRNAEINGIGTMESAEKDELVFAFRKVAIEKIHETKSKIIISRPLFYLKNDKTFIFTLKSMEEVFYTVMQALAREKEIREPMEGFRGEGCVLEEGSYVHKNSYIGANTVVSPGVVIEKNVKIGDNCVIHPNAVIKEDSILGDGAIIDSGACIGAEPFRAVRLKNRMINVKGLKGVSIGDGSFIGANTSIEKGVLLTTIIGKFCTIGGIVTIAHDCRVGDNVRMVSQTGIAGECTVGNNTMMYGQVGVADKINIGNNVTIFAKSGVRSDIADNKSVSGIPAIDHRDNLKLMVSQRKEFSNYAKRKKKNTGSGEHK